MKPILLGLKIQTNMIASQLAILYNTVHMPVSVNRHVFLRASADADTVHGGYIEIEESCFDGRRKSGCGNGRCHR